jgi:enterobactin synthetase component D / holo-[acyl-carrier protein] synthase
MPDEFRLKNILQTMAESQGLTNCAIEVGLVESFANAPLFPSEITAMASVAPRRLATFRGGRACARAGLRELGSPDVAIPIGPSGAPMWPSGFVGSITHTSEIAAAIVARSPQVRGLGLDLETDEPFDDASMVNVVCRPGELTAERDPSDPANLARGKLIFVIKEAAYKLYRPLSDAFLEFHDLGVLLDKSANAFRAELVNPQRPAVAGSRNITGVFAEAEGLYIALASLR